MITAKFFFDTWIGNRSIVHNLGTRWFKFPTTTSLVNTAAYYNALAHPNRHVETLTRPDDVIVIDELATNGSSGTVYQVITRVEIQDDASAVVEGTPANEP